MLGWVGDLRREETTVLFFSILNSEIRKLFSFALNICLNWYLRFIVSQTKHIERNFIFPDFPSLVALFVGICFGIMNLNYHLWLLPPTYTKWCCQALCHHIDCCPFWWCGFFSTYPKPWPGRSKAESQTCWEVPRLNSCHWPEPLYWLVFPCHNLESPRNRIPVKDLSGWGCLWACLWGVVLMVNWLSPQWVVPFHRLGPELCLSTSNGKRADSVSECNFFPLLLTENVMQLATCISALASSQQWVVTWNCEPSELFPPMSCFCSRYFVVITAMKSEQLWRWCCIMWNFFLQV